MSDTHSGADDRDDIPALNDCIGEIPDLQVGDKIQVKLVGDYRDDKTLTVAEIGTDAAAAGLMERRFDGGYVLTGYGTKYHLYVAGTSHWKAVNLTWPSHDDADRVCGVEVMERANNVE